MTRDEFIAAHAHDHFGRLMRCLGMDKNAGLSLKWLSVQAVEIEGWLGKIFDHAQELSNAPKPKQPEGKSGAPGAGGPLPKAASGRNAG